MAKERYKWSRVTDPDGNSKWVRSRERSRAQKASDALGKARFGLGGATSVLLLIMLFRFVLVKDFDMYDPMFVSYGDGSGLYYFNIFQYLKDFGTGLGLFKQALEQIFNVADGMPEPDNPALVLNILIVALNVLMSLFKMLVVAPFTLVCLLLGGWFSPWIQPGGWVYEFFSFKIPYVDISAFWNSMVNAISEWWFSWWPWQ